MGATWAGRLMAAIGLCVVVWAARGDEPRSYIFFPPPQPGPPTAGTPLKPLPLLDGPDTKTGQRAPSDTAKNASGPSSAAKPDADKAKPASEAGKDSAASEKSDKEKAGAETPKPTPDPETEDGGPDVKAARAEIADRLKALPEANDKDATAAAKALRTALEERLQCIDDWEKAVKDRHEAEHPKTTPEKQAAELKADLERVTSSLQQVTKDADSAIPAVFRQERGKALSDAARMEMKEAIESAQNDVKEWIEKEEKAQPDSAKPAESRLTLLRSERDKIQQSLKALKSRRAERENAVSAAKTKEARELARERQQNLEWEARVEAERLLTKEAQLTLQTKLAGLTPLRLEVAKGHLELNKKILQRMQQLYQALATREENDLKRAAASEEKRAAKSDDALERFRARRNAELLEMEALVKKGDNLVATDAFPTETAEHEKTQKAEDDLAQIKSLLVDNRVSQLDALRLNNDFRRIGPERDRIVKNELAATTARLTYLENALSSVELSLINDERDDRAELESLLERLPRSRHDEAKAVAEPLEKRHTQLLLQRKHNLEKLIESAEKAHNEIERRLRILDEEYGFIRTHIFWVRDQEPLGKASLVLAEREVVRLAKALFRLAAETGDRAAWGKVSAEFVLAVVLAVALPWPLSRVRRWLRARGANRNDARTPLGDLKTMGYDIAAAAVWSLYIANFAYAARQAPWPRGTSILMASILGAIAVAALGVNFTFVHLRRDGWAEVVLQVPESVTRQLRRVYLLLIASAFLFLLPSVILSQEMLMVGGRPVTAPAVSRLLDLAFGIVVGGVVISLARGKSALFEWLVQVPDRWGWMNRRRRVVAWSLLAFIGSGGALDAFGYSFTAHRLALGAIQALLILALCGGLYRLLAQAIDHQAWRWIRPGSHGQAPGTATDASGHPNDLAGRLRRLVAYVVPLLGMALCAWVWDLDGSLFRYIGEYPIFPINRAKEGGAIITFGDATQAALFVFLTAVVWRHMSTFFAVTVFPRMPDDPGVRFAVLTLCRYTVLAAGVLGALMSVHVGPQQLGMTLAALGVGLGFGLQEIVSNFVCGIILLLERPIRVGDIVTVSDMTGKVDRINIRATTIINGDNQSMLVPNRAFITGDLINWTLKDKVVRATVRMKVAHGNNPDRVTDLLLTIAREDPDVLRNPVPAAMLEDFADSAMVFVLHVHVPDPSLVGRVKHRLLTQIQHRFKEEGIGIPLPSQEFIVRPAPDAAVSFFTAPVGIQRVDPGGIAPPAPHWNMVGHAAEELEETRRGVDE